MVQPRRTCRPARARSLALVGIAGAGGTHPATAARLGREHRHRRPGTGGRKARPCVRGVARRERARDRRDGWCLRSHSRCDRHRARDRGSHRFFESEAPAGDLRGGRDARDDRRRARASRGSARRRVLEGARPLRQACRRPGGAPRSRRRAARRDGAALAVTLSASLSALDDADDAILDLPDIDSTTPEHRARVDELLPRVDAVVWVADPEKYRDAVLHDQYLRRWAPRLARQLVVLNKADRVGSEAERLRAHLVASLRAEGIENVNVAVTSATRDGDAHELRDWIADGVQAKRIISERVATELHGAALDLATRAGVSADAKPLLTAEQRAQVLADVTREAAAIIDLAGLERQAVAATRLAARPRGAGPFGLVTTFLYRVTGRDRVVADPEGYLRRWRERGSLARAAEPIRNVIGDLLPRVPSETRGAIATLVDAQALNARITGAIDAAVATRA